jgi:hypothetical protein
MIEFVLAVAVVAAAAYAYKHYATSAKLVALKSAISDEITKAEATATADYAKVVAAIKAKL